MPVVNLPFDGPIRSVGLVINSEREGAVSFAEVFTSWLESQGLTVCASRSITEKASAESDAAFECLVHDSDLVIVCGGDGSLVGTSRRVAEAGKPILGVHWGGIGFLNECQPEQAREALARILKGDYFIENRAMLLAEVWRDGECWRRIPALNDVAVTRDTLSRILRLEVTVGDELAAAYQGDGILVSTPTGSTGHSLSAGGPIMDPRVDALVLTPICPHLFNGRAIVVPSSERLRIRHTSPLANVVITIDGQVGMVMRDTDFVDITRAPFAARFVRLGYNRFYQTLRDKLQWKL